MADVVSLSDLETVPHATVFGDTPARTVRLELTADQQVPAHSHPDTVIVLHLVSGELELRLDSDRLELTPGDLARFSGDREIAPRDHRRDGRARLLSRSGVGDGRCVNPVDVGG